MRSKLSKTRNLKVYVSFLDYNRPIDVPLEKLAKRYKCHKNKIISLIGCAQRYETIYQSLIAIGYTDAKIPTWFRRPEHMISEDQEALNAAPGEPIAEQQSGYAETLNVKTITRVNPIHRSILPRDHAAYFTDSERRPSWLRGTPTTVPPQDTICYIHTFDGKVFPVDNRAISRVHASPLERMTSELRWEVNRRTNDILEDYEKRTFQRIIESIENSLEPQHSTLITDPIEQFASNLSNPKFLEEWMSMTPQQQNNVIELLRQRYYTQNPWNNPWNWWMMIKLLQCI